MAKAKLGGDDPNEDLLDVICVSERNGKRCSNKFKLEWDVISFGYSMELYCMRCGAQGQFMLYEDFKKTLDGN